MNLAEYRTAMRTELSDSSTFFSNDEIDRAVEKTVSLLSRFIPKRSVLETCLHREIEDESLTISSDEGTLAYKPVKHGSLAISGETENTDYEINHLTGVVTELNSKLADGSYTANYELDPKMLDISTILPKTSYIRIERVEYPVGNNPATYVLGFEVMGEFLIIKSDEDLADDEHLRIIYTEPWTAPAVATDGDYPEHLDNPLIIGACGQALVFKAEKYVQQSITELELVNTAADSMSTSLADINTALDQVATQVGYAETALDKVSTYLETNGTSDNAKEVLADIADEASDLRTAMETALDDASTYLTGGSAPGANNYLTSGDDYITSINDAERVAEKYSEYARAAIAIYQGLVAEATVRLDNIRSYIEQSNGWIKIGNAFTAEGAQRLNSAQAYIQEANYRVAEVNAWATQADRYATTSREYLNIAGRFLASGQAKINEFLTAIGVKPELYAYKSSSEQRA